MNTNDDLSRDDAPLDASLRLQLRGLRRELAPERDLWPGIAARIAVAPAATHRASPRRFAPWALAASLLLALGVAWQLRPPAPVAAPLASRQAPQQAPARLIGREAEAMTREYSAALHELQASAPDAATPRKEQPALRELDRSARQIRTALARDPDARFLLERLRRTYSLRLELTQRAALT